MPAQRRSPFCGLQPFVACGVLVLGVGSTLLSVRAEQFFREGKIQLRPALAAQPDADIGADEESGAALKTNPELDRMLNEAERLAAEGRFDLGVVLWQRVLDESGDTVMTRDGWVDQTRERSYRKYRSVADEVERTLAGLPPAGLQTYRLVADGEAQAILADSESSGREAALSQVVRRYFLSSVGDEAAFELACLLLDRYEFVGAGRLLSKLLHSYPDRDIPTDQILLRLAVAHARVGDLRAAAAVLDQLRKMESPRGRERSLELVRADIERQGVSDPRQLSSAEGWPSALGGPERSGHMQSLPEDAVSADLSEFWTHSYESDLPALAAAGQQGTPQAVVWNGNGFFGANVQAARVMINGRVVVNGAQPQTSVDAGAADVIQRWRNGGWTPAGQLLLHDGRIYFKSGSRLVCVDAEMGGLEWMSVRPNQFEMDGLSRMYVQYAAQMGSGDRPRSAAEVFLFGDRVHHEMAIVDGAVYTLEGPDGAGDASGQVPHAGPYSGSTPRRTRRNWLAAYDAVTGKMLPFYRAAHEADHEMKSGVGFLGAPVPYGKLLIAPVTDNGEIWLLAMQGLRSERPGETVWRSYLCDEPEGGSSPWSPIRLSVDGGDVYAATGAGAVFAVDALTGSIRWAVRYDRSAQPIPQFQHSFQLSRLEGWDEDVTIPHGRTLVVMASDSDVLFALDRRDGAFLWDSPRHPSEEDGPARYCLGVLGDGLFVAGQRAVRRYNIHGGKLTWQADLPADSLGRGVLTADAIYLPSNDSVVRLDPQSGKQQRHVGFISTSSNGAVPVGNLYSDGNRLLALGFGRVYALTDLNRRLSALGDRIDSGDGDAQFDRMRLRHRQGDLDAAMADLQAGHQRLLKSAGAAAANSRLFLALEELNLARVAPKVTLQRLLDAARAADSAPEAQQAAIEESDASRRKLLIEVLGWIERENVRGTVPELLAVAATCRDDRELTMLQRAVAKTADAGSAELLEKALEHENPQTRAVAVATVGRVLDEKSTPLLQQALNDADPRVQLSAALGLANRGERAALPALGQLLEAENTGIRTESARALRHLTGQSFPVTADQSPEQTAKAAAKWQEWITANGETAELNFPIPDGPELFGRTLIVTYGQTPQVVEIDEAGKVLWRQSVHSCFGCQGLPNGHRLVSSYQHKVVMEYDGDGKQVWRATINGSPWGVNRLENGNTLVACYDGSVQELNPSGTVVWRANIPRGQPVDAQRLENGRTLIALLTGGQVIEVDENGKTVWELNNMGNPRSAQRLSDGNTLIAQFGNNRVVEVNRKGEVTWSVSGFINPTDAQRLSNGNTLISHSQGVVEVDPSGTRVWSHDERRVGRVYRY